MFSDVPELDIVLLNRPEVAPLGAGELSIVPVPAAIANGIFDATGIRLREVPFTPKRVLAGLQAATQTSKAS
jgi:CO/xanthine dehydrogenase Mo-binding subunit